MSTFFLVDTQRSTTRGLEGDLALPEESLVARAQAHAGAVHRLYDQAFARFLADAPMDAIRARAAEVKSDDIVLMGIGGSALGAATIHEALRPASPWAGKRLHVLDHLDPDRCVATLEEGFKRGAHFLVISKSGDTTETMALASVLDRLARPAQGALYGRELVTVVTNEVAADRSNANTVVRRWAKSIEATVIDMPIPLGGRFSVLSAVGLLPAALLGYDAQALLDGGRAMAEELSRVEPTDSDPIGNPALELASAIVGLDLERGVGTQVIMPYASKLGRLGAWFVQLWAESLGKATLAGQKAAGPAGPIAGVGPTDQHSFAQLLLEGRRDKVVLFLDALATQTSAVVEPHRAFGDALEPMHGRTLGEILSLECFATELALSGEGRPSAAIRLHLPTDARGLGALFVFFETVTYLAGAMYGIEPYDQPGVQLIKAHIKEGLVSGVGDGTQPDDRLGRERRFNGGFPLQLPGLRGV
jgi:glucose-6-phosphate isomerase